MELDEQGQSKFLMRVKKNVGKTIFDYSLFQQDDRVLIGLSGGKDSLSLLDLLVEWNSRSPVKVRFFACYVELLPLGHKLDLAALQSFCDARGVPLQTQSIDFDMAADPRKDRCFLCAWHRRKVLFDLADRLGCSKLALGHHLDDIVTTLLMNMCRKGIFATMPVRLNLFQGTLAIVRPLARLEENEIRRYALLRHLQVQHQDCPHGQGQSRVHFREVLETMTRLEPHAKHKLFRAMSDIRQEYLS